MRVIIAGASGLIGSALTEQLTGAGHEVVRLGRHPVRGAADEAHWDPASGAIDETALTGAHAVVNLAGAGIGDERWTDERRNEIWASRVEGTELLVSAMTSRSEPPAVFLSGSAIGHYGDRGDEVLTEESPPGSGFLSDLTVAWEAAADPAEAAGVRVVKARTGLVVSRDAPFLTRMLPLFKLGLGGPLGRGRQFWSWISLTDQVRALAFLLDADVRGPVNLCSPNPLTNRDFARTLGRVLHRPSVLPVPRFGPALLFGRDLTDELLFASTRAHPAVLAAAGFEFHHPELQPTLEEILQ